MNVLLINPPSPYLDNDAAYPPMGLMYVAAAVERAGHNARIIDMAGGWLWGDQLKTQDWTKVDFVGITCVSPNVPQVSEICKAIPKSVPVMVGGAHPTHLPWETIQDTGCSFVVRGEIENVMGWILDDISNGVSQRIYWKPPPDKDHIPKPARHLVDLHRYTPGGDAATPVYTTRGCPFNCAFCSKTAGQTCREVPIPQVIEEVKECCTEYGFNKIVFGDDNIAIRAGRLVPLLDALRPLDISFRLNMDARHNEWMMFQKAYGSGCTDISFGIESGSQKILNAMNKLTTVEKNMESIRMTRRAGMEAKAYFMVNFPGETEETVKETLRFAEQARPDKWMLSAFAPLPGSDTFIHPEKYGITSMSKNWSDYYLVGKNGQFKPCFTTEYLTGEKQVELHEMMWNGLKDILG